MHRDFIEAMLIRGVRTVCQAALATIGTATMMGEVNWKMVASSALLAGVVSILMSVATGLPEVKKDE